MTLKVTVTKRDLSLKTRPEKNVGGLNQNIINDSIFINVVIATTGI